MSSPYSNAVSDPADPQAALTLPVSAAVFAAGVATFVNMYCTQAILPVLGRTFAAPQATTGLTVTAPLLATALMAPLIGVISDRLGRKRLILGAAALLVIPTLLASDAASIDRLILWRFVQGLLLPFIFTVTIAYIGDETSGPDTVRLAGTYMSGAVFGGFFGRWVTGLCTAWLGWRFAFIGIAVVTAAMAATIAFCLPAERRFTPMRGLVPALRAFPLHLANPQLRATYAIGFGVLFSFIAIFTFVNFRLAAPPYLMGPAALGSIFVVYLGGVVVTPIGARLAARHGRRKVFAIAAPGAMLGLLLTLSGHLALIVAGLLLFSSMMFIEQTLATAFVGSTAREAKSIAVGLYVTFYYIGGGCGGIVPAIPFRAFGWPGCVALALAVQAMMLALVLRYWRTPNTAD